MKVRNQKRRFQEAWRRTTVLKLTLPVEVLEELRTKYRDVEALIVQQIRRAVEWNMRHEA